MKNILKQILLKIRILNKLIIQFILIICLIFLNDLKGNNNCKSKIEDDKNNKENLSIKKIRLSFIFKILKIYNQPDDNIFKKLFYDYFFKNPLKHWHKFHIVSSSPWPFFVSVNLLSFLLHFVSLLNRDYTSIPGLLWGLFFLILAVIFWFKDIICESTYMGYHTIKVQMMHRTGFALFLVSEVMIFFGVFWAYFHFSLTPSIFGGNIWPPEGIVLFFLSEDLWSELRLLYLSGFYDYTIDHQSYLNFFDGLIGYSKNFIISYLFLFFLFDFFITFNIDFFYNYLFLIDNLGKEVDSWQFTDEEKIFYPKEIFMKNGSYSLYSLNIFYDNPLKYDSKVIYLNVYDSGALINPYHIPLLNTIILLTSGCILMWSHTCLRLQSYFKSVIGLFITIFLALYFIGCQAYEYIHAPFSINDGSYGSIFYLLTGLHGFHVIVGTIFLCVCLYRLIDAHFTSTNHFGFEASIWYWHFVDVVWIFLYIFVYVWPSVYYFSNSLSTFLDNSFWNLDLTEKNFLILNNGFIILNNHNNSIYFNINYKDIEKVMPIFDYNKNIWHDFSIKIPIIYHSFVKGIPFNFKIK